MTKTLITAYVDPATYANIKQIAYDTKQTRSEIIDAALKEYIVNYIKEKVNENVKHVENVAKEFNGSS